MFEITGITQTDLRLTRGDSATLAIGLTDENGEEYKLKAGDKLALCAKRAVNDKAYAIQLQADENAQFTFKPSDTAKLAYGSYYYDIQLTQANGNVYTVIPLSHIVITEEVAQ